MSTTMSIISVTQNQFNTYIGKKHRNMQRIFPTPAVHIIKPIPTAVY